MSQSASTKHIIKALKVIEEVDFWEKRDTLRELLNIALKESLRTGERSLDKEKVEVIKRYVSEQLKVDYKNYTEKNRYEKSVELRHLAIYFSRMILNYTLEDISIYFGHANHSTTINAVNRIKFRYKNYKEYRKKVDEMEGELVNLL